MHEPRPPVRVEMTYDPEPVSVIPGQLSLNPVWPKEGTVKAAVLELLLTHPEGICRRAAAEIDVYELSNRIGELESDGWQIKKQRCTRHHHKHRFMSYSI